MGNLYEHNAKAVKAVLDAFKTQQRAAVVHATGTGKAYIVAAVAEQFERVIILAPNNFVLEEARKVNKPHVKYGTYMSMLYNETPNTNYDLIVFDEFHRAGASEWSKGVERLIEANPQAKLLGTSATHIRYLDNERNMADELFDSNIVSRLSVSEAISRNILPNPTYVSSLYQIDESIASARYKISKAKNIDDSKKQEYYRHLDGIKDSWDKSNGVSAIIRKYFSKDMKRIIVFCSNVVRSEEARKLIDGWLVSAGYRRIKFYNIDYKNNFVEEHMAKFQEDVDDGTLKVALSVNMLNEGVHVPNIDGIIMMRSTISRIIIEQQVGRCLTADNKGKTPVVLDLVNNMDIIKTSFSEVYFGNRYDTKCQKGDTEGFPFRVIDECRDFRLFYEQIESECDSSDKWDIMQPKLQAYYDEHGHLNVAKNDDLQMYRYLKNYRNKAYLGLHPERIAWLVERGFRLEKFDKASVDERLDYLERMADLYGDTALLRKNDKRGYEIYKEFAHKRGKRAYTDEQHRRADDILSRIMNKEKRWWVRATSVAERMKNGDIPQSDDIDRKWMASQMRIVKDDKKIAFMRENGFYDLIKPIHTNGNKDLYEFVSANHRLPTPKDDRVLYECMWKFKRESAQRNDPKLFQLLLDNGFVLEKKFARDKRPYEVKRDEFFAYCKEHKSLPPQYHPLSRFYNQNRKKHPELVEFAQQYVNKQMQYISCCGKNNDEEMISRIKSSDIVFGRGTYEYNWWGKKVRRAKKRGDTEMLARLMALEPHISTLMTRRRIVVNDMIDCLKRGVIKKSFYVMIKIIRDKEWYVDEQTKQQVLSLYDRVKQQNKIIKYEKRRK